MSVVKIMRGGRLGKVGGKVMIKRMSAGEYGPIVNQY